MPFVTFRAIRVVTMEYQMGRTKLTSGDDTQNKYKILPALIDRKLESLYKNIRYSEGVRQRRMNKKRLMLPYLVTMCPHMKLRI